MKERRRLPKLTLEQLETWFDKARPAPPCDGVSKLNGFLTGLVAGPVFIAPNDWMDEVIVTGASTPRCVPGARATQGFQPSLAASVKVGRSGLQCR
jgi:yecA family protein